MIDLTWIDPTHGMSLRPGPHAGRDNENGVLFYLHYILIKEALGLPIQEDVEMFKSIIERIRTYDDSDGTRIPGLYDRGQDESLTPHKDQLRTISHDNLTAIAAFSYRYGDPAEVNKIAKYGMLHWNRYDNAYPHKPRIITTMWPTDLGFWTMCSKNPIYIPWAVAMFPLFWFRCFLTNTNKPGETSGKLLNFVRFAAMRDKNPWGWMGWKIHSSMMRLMYGKYWIHELMKIYFIPTHPNGVLSENLSF